MEKYVIIIIFQVTLTVQYSSLVVNNDHFSKHIKNYYLIMVGTQKHFRILRTIYIYYYILIYLFALFYSTLKTMVNCTQRMFLANPEPQPKIISSQTLDKYNSYEIHKPEHVLTRNGDDIHGSYWLAPNNMQGEFVMDMGSDVLVVGVELVNTVNCKDDGCQHQHSRDRATGAFKVYLALSEAGPWTEVLSDELEDPRQDPLPLPLLTFTFPPTEARFIRFNVLYKEVDPSRGLTVPEGDSIKQFETTSPVRFRNIESIISTPIESSSYFQNSCAITCQSHLTCSAFQHDSTICILISKLS